MLHNEFSNSLKIQLFSSWFAEEQKISKLYKRINLNNKVRLDTLCFCYFRPASHPLLFSFYTIWPIRLKPGTQVPKILEK